MCDYCQAEDEMRDKEFDTPKDTEAKTFKPTILVSQDEKLNELTKKEIDDYSFNFSVYMPWIKKA